jgi:hypothetical protein
MTDYPPSAPINEVLRTGYRDDSVRLREILIEASALNTHDVTKLCAAASRVWAYARSIAGEIGLDFKNPPVPAVMCSTVKNCPPSGEQAGRCQECPGTVAAKAGFDEGASAPKIRRKVEAIEREGRY